ncbi:hypothetical protein [Streptosporangium sp. NPDC020145]|uniref:hypothetical protein n=1 Tax=Streptosporangium sp. NPDC020145 TaxID=3154694 RepID=UPI003445BBA0
MRTRPLGRTGMRVSPYCPGTMMFGRAGNPDHDENVIDTADVYSYSETEDIVEAQIR